MATAAPPAPPRVKLQTAQTRRQYYTLHSNRNNAFTLKLNEDVRTAIVGFVKIEDALCIGNMIETYYIEQKEWPSLYRVEDLSLPEGRLNHLAHVFVQEWEFDELKINCTRNFLDMVSVEELEPRNAKYSLNGNLYIFDAPVEFYRERIAELYLY
jgi:hypothetical protein